MPSMCGVTSGSFGGDGVQVWRVAGNVLNKQRQTSDKGCSPVWLLGKLLTTQHLNSLLRYGTFYKTSDWD